LASSTPTKSGISSAIDDMVIPATSSAGGQHGKVVFKSAGSNTLRRAITMASATNKVVAILSANQHRKSSPSKCSKRGFARYKEASSNRCTVRVMAIPALRVSRSSTSSRLSGMLCLMASHPEKSSKRPSLSSNFREGLTVAAYFILDARVARTGLAAHPLSRRGRFRYTSRASVRRGAIRDQHRNHWRTADSSSSNPSREAGRRSDSRFARKPNRVPRFTRQVSRTNTNATSSL